ncbi:uncharacterized protein LOC132459283 [Gadus macrocephalus]|uniref:uncharacterized protein LOC132459283 n=1 Tax=Gadus macrocephalus TaxID=80720 RepID=UPI0028CB61AA|nr:uncharacterized protein LOC132459283 [Gadus macrocephalus]XP_059909678.1 uncharacterized protein LOC132459283 [Gadus macrocephalus]
MDQRAKGGTPPTASTTKPSTPPAPRGPSSEEPRRDRARDRKRSRDKEVVENGEEEGKEMEDERRGAGRVGPGGDKGTVLELLIEGRCGDAGPPPLLYPGPADGPEGNVRLRIGLQAKRTKKPPKMLEATSASPPSGPTRGRAGPRRRGPGAGRERWVSRASRAPRWGRPPGSRAPRRTLSSPTPNKLHQLHPLHLHHPRGRSDHHYRPLLRLSRLLPARGPAPTVRFLSNHPRRQRQMRTAPLESH